MKLNKFISQLQLLEAQGHGEAQVFYRHGSSGDCGLLRSAYITSEIDSSTGPFDLEEGEQYIYIYAGN